MTALPALVAASHGTSDAAGQRAVAALVAAVERSSTETTVRGSFVDVQQPDVPQTLSELETGRAAIVVPLLLSAGYHVRVDLARDARETVERRVTIAEALGPDDRLTEVLIRRLGEAGLRPDDAVVLGAAGSSDPRAVEDCRIAASMLSRSLGRPVTVGFISAAAPPLADAVAQARSGRGEGARVVIATYLLAPGYFAGLAATAGADLVTAPLLADGEPVPAELVRVVRDRYRSACDADVSSPLHSGAEPVTTW